MKLKIYVETSIPSFYHEIREEPEMIARRDWTREWWSVAVQRDLLVTSAAVIEELSKGEYPIKQECLGLIGDLPLLPAEPAVVQIVETYMKHHVMPKDPAGDALHLALASYHKCDFLVTWNCRNLANANKFGHIRRTNTLLGLYVPALVTPLELIAGKGDEEDENNEESRSDD